MRSEARPWILEKVRAITVLWVVAPFLSRGGDDHTWEMEKRSPRKSLSLLKMRCLSVSTAQGWGKSRYYFPHRDLPR